MDYSDNNKILLVFKCSWSSSNRSVLMFSFVLKYFINGFVSNTVTKGTM